MAIKQGIARLERMQAERSREVEDARRKELEFRADRDRDHLCLFPEYRWIIREDCFDDEVWNHVRGMIAMADYDFKEAARLKALPAPREAAFQAWVNAAPTVVGQIQRICTGPGGPNYLGQAAEKAKARGNPKGAWR